VTVIGGKTGTTNAALNCLIQVVRDKQNKTYIAIILHVSERGIINSEMEELLQEITAD
jgi:D-alanyl-D-alanine carboxypeptidase